MFISTLAHGHSTYCLVITTCPTQPCDVCIQVASQSEYRDLFVQELKCYPCPIQNISSVQDSNIVKSSSNLAPAKLTVVALASGNLLSTISSTYLDRFIPGSILLLAALKQFDIQLFGGSNIKHCFRLSNNDCHSKFCLQLCVYHIHHQ